PRMRRMKTIIKAILIITGLVTVFNLRAEDPAYRKFPEKELQELRNTSDYQYHRPHYQGESLWERFLKMLQEWFRELFGSGPTVRQIEITFYILALVVIVWVIIKLLGIEFHGVFRKAPAKTGIIYQVNEESLDQIDFKEQIAKALADKQWQLVIRLQYLFALKKLADKGLIKVVSGKTNHDYLYELTQESVSVPFSRLSTLFEYTWYGRFEVTENILQEAQGQFRSLEERLG
ncbi:MAG: DUF4129 domain-containing protein, partial [Owenweeksia sp.]